MMARQSSIKQTAIIAKQQKHKIRHRADTTTIIV